MGAWWHQESHVVPSMDAPFLLHLLVVFCWWSNCHSIVVSMYIFTARINQSFLFLCTCSGENRNIYLSPAEMVYAIHSQLTMSYCGVVVWAVSIAVLICQGCGSESWCCNASWPSATLCTRGSRRAEPCFVWLYLSLTCLVWASSPYYIHTSFTFLSYMYKLESLCMYKLNFLMYIQAWFPSSYVCTRLIFLSYA